MAVEIAQNLCIRTLKKYYLSELSGQLLLTWVSKSTRTSENVFANIIIHQIKLNYISNTYVTALELTHVDGHATFSLEQN